MGSPCELGPRTHRSTVSVIIPCYNQGRYLADAIRSVLDQSYTAIEVIVVDDGSSDESPDVARAFGAQVRLIRIPNSGPAAARNAGLRVASGEFVQFLDADDRLEPRKIQTHVDFFAAHPEIGLVYGDARCFTTEQPDLRWYRRIPGGGDGPWIEARSTEPGTWLERCLGAPPFHSCCPLFRRALVELYGGLNERLVASEDWELWIRLAAYGVQFAYHSGPESLALIRYSRDSLTSNARRVGNGHLSMRRVIGHYLPDELRPRNFTYGLAAIARYCRPQERPPEIARLLVANWGPALRAHLVYATAKRGGESLPGRALRMVMRAVVPYSTRRRIRAHLGADKED